MNVTKLIADMISERRLANQFHGCWQDSLPFLSPAFVRMFNEAYQSELMDDIGNRVKPIIVGMDVEHNDLVAELGFHLAKTSFELSIKASDIYQDSDLYDKVLGEALNLVNKYEGRKPADKIVLNTSELSEALQLANNYPIFLENVAGDGGIEFSPKIPGAGFLGICEADLSVGNTLYEVKTVSRNIAGKDIRQLMIYLGLQWATNNRRWSYAGFFNPRRAIYYKFSIDHFVFRASGGRSSAEVFGDFIDFLSQRGFEIDTAF